MPAHRPKRDPMTGNRLLTPDELRVAINHLQTKIVVELGGQAACDRLEAELQVLIAQTTPIAGPPVSRKTTTRTSTEPAFSALAETVPAAVKPRTRRGSPPIP